MMEREELQQLLKYKESELSERLQKIHLDFTDAKIVDDVLFALAQNTKLELRNVRKALTLLQDSKSGSSCLQCYENLFISLKRENPFQTHCDSCDNKKNR